MNILYPISLDRWTNPISSKFREIAVRSAHSPFRFFSFSSPQNVEDKLFGPPLWARKQILELGYHELLTKKFDLVHRSTGTLSNSLIVRSAKLRNPRIKQVFTIGTEPREDNPFYRYIDHAISSSSYLIANSQSVARYVEDHWERQVDRVIYNGVDSDFFDPSLANLRFAEQQNVQDPYFLFNSTINHLKNAEFAISLAQDMGLNLIMIGRMTAEGKKMLEGLPPNIRYLGMVKKSEVRDLLARAEALLFPSSMEGLPNAVLESLVMGVPVIAQRISSLPELILDETNGWLMSNTNLQEWKTVISNILETPRQQRAILRKEIRERTKLDFSWENYARDHLMIYKDLISDRNTI